MTAFDVRRAFETVATDLASNTGTAKSDARTAVREAVEAAGGDDLATLSIDDVTVYEFPASSFDPFRMTVQGSVTVTVDADDDAAARTAGATAIDDVLAAADLDGYEYTGDAAIVESE